MDEQRLTFISGELVRENVVGKTITGMTMLNGGGDILLRLEGEACPVMDLIIAVAESPVPTDSTNVHLPVVLWVRDEDETHPQETPGQLNILEALEEMTVAPQESPGISSSFACRECGCGLDAHEEGQCGHGAGACGNCEACGQYEGSGT